jgi:hypothetical protein
MTIQVGDTVEIPKGVEVFEGYTHGTMHHFDYLERKLSARKSKVVVETVIEVTKWWTLLNKDEHEEITKRSGIWSHWLFDSARGLYDDTMGPIVYAPGDRNGTRMTASAVDDWLVSDKRRVPIERQPEIDALFAEYEAKVRERFGDLKFIDWAGGKKSTLLANVVPATAAAPKAPKEQKITKRRLMLPGARFKFTSDVEIRIWISNPEIWRLCKKRDSYRVDRNSQRMHGSTMVVTLGGGREQTQAELDAMASIQAQINVLPSQINVLAAKVPSGCVVEITDKPVASNSYSSKKESNGLMVPMKVIADGPIKVAQQFLTPHWDNPLSNGGNIAIPYSQIEAAIEVIEGSVPENVVWALRDRASGEYFGGWESERKGSYNRQTNTPKMSATFSGSKKYKNLSALKASIMDFTGYHAGLEQEDYVEEWVGGSEKKIDLPDTWEAVAVDKTTNAEKRVEDVVEWYEGLMRLRVLTAQFGSALRGVYKKVEKKEGYEAIVVFKLPDDFDIDDPALLKQMKLIEECVEASGAEKTVRNTTERTMAYAVQSQIDATMMILGYQGEGTVKAFDIANLQEIVPEAAA